MSEFAIEFNEVVKDYGQHRAVDTINLAIRKGELVTFLGPSGCGKTTSLRLIAGLELPTSGQVLIQGKDVSQRPASERNVGMVFQSYALFPHMTVLDNVAYGPVIRGVKKAEAENQARTLLNQVGLTNLESRFPSELSGGQQQRVAVARAIVQQPDVMLFDEPLSNVDAKLRRRVRAEIRELQQRFGLTAVYVTHDQEEALAVSDRIIVMSAGKIEQIGTPEDLYDRPKNAFVADFIGDANLLTGVIQKGVFQVGSLRIPVDHQERPSVTISVRPERIRLSDINTETEANGIVLEATYLGSRMEYLIDMGHGMLLCSRPIEERRRKVREEVAIEVQPEDVSLID
ncbi:MAG: ABC transporter ATP-binding protein [Saccharospirillum sp.]|nr:ABC transporter ATP-binding protein [Saccharospirillum sp.]